MNHDALHFPSNLLRNADNLLLCGPLLLEGCLKGLRGNPLFLRLMKSEVFGTLQMLTILAGHDGIYTVLEVSSHSGGTWRLFDMTEHPCLSVAAHTQFFPMARHHNRRSLLHWGNLPD